MDGQYDHNDFEHFIKQNADAHRLYPSDRVWTNMYSRLHGKRRRTLALLLLVPLLSGAGLFLLQAPYEKTTHVYGTAKLRPSITYGAQEEIAHEVTANEVAAREFTAREFTAHEAAAHETFSAPLTETTEVRVPSENNLAAVESNPGLATTDLLSPVEATANTQATDDIPVKEYIQEEKYPLSIESVVNSYQRQLHQPRFKWQIHFTPTVSYRTLQEDQKFIAQARISSSAASAFNTTTTDLASVIRHRPDIGMQLGFTGTYPISKKIDWVTGIQFNVSKYDIAAYNYPSEVATIALMNPWGGTSTVSTITSFRSNGFRSTANWLRNYYYSVSMPIGLQWRVLGKKHTHWGISATVQPTYVVGNRSYVISADYQNYAEVPYLINKWNLNVGFETFARFQLGKNDFQVGPQIRYQALSSFKKGYPVQEHLYDFGIKLGMVLGK